MQYLDAFLSFVSQHWIWIFLWLWSGYYGDSIDRKVRDAQFNRVTLMYSLLLGPISLFMSIAQMTKAFMQHSQWSFAKVRPQCYMALRSVANHGRETLTIDPQIALVWLRGGDDEAILRAREWFSMTTLVVMGTLELLGRIDHLRAYYDATIVVPPPTCKDDVTEDVVTQLEFQRKMQVELTRIAREQTNKLNRDSKNR